MFAELRDVIQDGLTASRADARAVLDEVTAATRLLSEVLPRRAALADAKGGADEEVMQEQRRSREEGEGKAGPLRDIHSCLSHLMEEATTRDSLLLDHNAQVSEIHAFTSQILERVSDPPHPTDLTPEALGEVKTRIKEAFDAHWTRQQKAFSESWADANNGKPSADIHDAIQSSLASLPERVSAALEITLKNVLEASLKRELQAGGAAEDREVLRLLRKDIAALAKVLGADDQEEGEDTLFAALKGAKASAGAAAEAAEAAREAAEAASTRAEAVANAVDVDSLEVRSQLADVHGDVLVLKKLQVETAAGLRKQLSELRPEADVEDELRLVVSGIAQLQRFLLALSDHWAPTTTPPPDDALGLLARVADAQDGMAQAVERAAKEAVESALSRGDRGVGGAATEEALLRRLPGMLSAVLEVSVAPDLAALRRRLDALRVDLRAAIMDAVRGPGASAAGEMAAAGAVALLRREEALAEGLQALHVASGDIVSELRRLARSASPRARRRREAKDGNAAVAAAAMLASHLAEETRRRQRVEADLAEAKLQLEAAEARLLRHGEAAAGKRQRRWRGAGLIPLPSPPPPPPAPRRPPPAPAKPPTTTKPKERGPKPETTTQSEKRPSGSDVTAARLAATRQRMRRMRTALHRLEQLSTSMEKHYQGMLREIGAWVVRLARAISAGASKEDPPSMADAVPFPAVASQVGTWFLHVCATARWALATLQMPPEGESAPKEQQIAIPDSNKTIYELQTSAEVSDTKNISDDLDIIPRKLTRSLILATVQQELDPTKSSNNNFQTHKNKIQLEMVSQSNGSDLKTTSEVSYTSCLTVKTQPTRPSSGKRKSSSNPISSDDPSLSVGSLDSVFSVVESSDTTNIQGTSLNDKAGSKGVAYGIGCQEVEMTASSGIGGTAATATSVTAGTSSRKFSGPITTEEEAEERLIAILDNLKEKLLNSDSLSLASGKE